MARQGLMDDAGYDFFDVSECSNYESCREDAYNDGYEKGRADAIEELSNKAFCEWFPCEYCAMWGQYDEFGEEEVCILKKIKEQK